MNMRLFSANSNRKSRNLSLTDETKNHSEKINIWDVSIGAVQQSHWPMIRPVGCCVLLSAASAVMSEVCCDGSSLCLTWQDEEGHDGGLKRCVAPRQDDGHPVTVYLSSLFSWATTLWRNSVFECWGHTQAVTVCVSVWHSHEVSIHSAALNIFYSFNAPI